MSSDERLIVAMGERRYCVERPWGECPDNAPMSVVSQLALDSHGRVYVCQRSDPPVIVFEPNGAHRRGWRDTHIADPHGITVGPDERVYVVDRDAHQILVFSPDGRLEDTLGERHAPRFQAPFNHPTAVAVSADGEIYVADGYGNSVVHRFSAHGELVRTWGAPGSGPGEFSTPHGIWIDRSNRVLVVDRENNRVQLFDREGQYLGQWGGFYHPMDLYEDSRGMVFVTDQTPRMSMMSPDGALAGRCRPVLNVPHGVWGNAQGDIFVAEMNPSRVTKLALLD